MKDWNPDQPQRVAAGIRRIQAFGTESRSSGVGGQKEPSDPLKDRASAFQTQTSRMNPHFGISRSQTGRIYAPAGITRTKLIAA
jgi:hypothetical protein